MTEVPEHLLKKAAEARARREAAAGAAAPADDGGAATSTAVAEPEEEVVETRVSPIRRFVVRRPEPEVPARLSDESGAMIREAVVDDTGANKRPSR